MTKRAVLVLLLASLLLGCSESEDVEQLASIYRKLNNGQYEEAIQESEEYTKNYPDSFKGWNELGWAHLKADHLEEAEKSFRKAIELNEQWDNAYVGLGVFYRKQDKLDEARVLGYPNMESIDDFIEGRSDIR